MSDRCFKIRRESGHIPSGRQLPRTPPSMDVRRHLDFTNDDPADENLQAEFKDRDDLNRVSDFNAAETKTEQTDHAMLKGMTGYQLTPSDLEFIEKMQEEKMIKKLQAELEEAQRLLKKEMMAAERTCATWEQAQAELKKFPTCGQLTEWLTVVLKKTLPLADLADLNAKSLLAMVTKEDVQRVMNEKKTELARMEKMVENKRKKEAEERKQLEIRIAREQLRIQGLMSELSDLKSELAQQEEAYKSVQFQFNTKEAPGVKEEAEKVDVSEIQDAKGQVKRRGRTKVAKSTENLQETANQSKPTRSGRASGKADDQTSVKNNEAKKTKLRSDTKKPTKSSRGPQKKFEENEQKAQEHVQTNPTTKETMREGRRPPGRGPITASQPKNRSKEKTGETLSSSRQEAADGGEDAANPGLRRSKRIASRR